MLYLIFIGLSVLMTLEFSNTYARIAGVRCGEISIGITMQNALSIIARTVASFTMPAIALVADREVLNKYSNRQLVIAIWIIPSALVLAYMVRHQILSLFLYSAAQLKKHGTIKLGYIHCRKGLLTKRVKAFNSIEALFLASYIPYYMAWPMTVFLTKIHPEYRATMMSTSTIFTGINTMIIAMIIDPKIVYITKSVRVAESILSRQCLLKIVASFVASIITTIIISIKHAS
jgi:hypothetical protein